MTIIKTPQQKYEEHQKAPAILELLRGKVFVMATGAKRLEALDNGLLFALPNYVAKQGINRVKIRQNAHGGFNVRFIKVDKERYTHDDVHVVNNVSISSNGETSNIRSRSLHNHPLYGRRNFEGRSV